MSKKEIKKAYSRYLEIVKILKENKDKTGMRLLDELIDKCRNYFQLVIEMELAIKNARFRKEGREYLEIVSNWEDRRTISHNAVISQIHILNRYLFKNYGYDNIPVGGIYSLDPEDISKPIIKGKRSLIGDWIGYLISGLYENKVITR